MRKERGFTLIELMVTVVIVAILAAIAVPSYTDYVKRGAIQEATTNLLTLRTKMEQWYQDNRTYVGTGGGTTCGTTMPTSKNTANPAGTVSYFTFTCTATASTYTITATGGVSGAGGNTSMASFVYTINEGNTHTTTSVLTGWGTTPKNCWIVKKDGTC